MKGIPSLSAPVILMFCSVSHGGESNPVNHLPKTPSTNATTPIALCVDADGCAKRTQHVAHGSELGKSTGATTVAGHPLTSVVVTQCNLVVAVYMTMPDGRFLRFDKKADVSAEELVTMAYTAAHSERVEVSCEGTGVVAYEKHEPI